MFWNGQSFVPSKCFDQHCIHTLHTLHKHSLLIAWLSETHLNIYFQFIRSSFASHHQISWASMTWEDEQDWHEEVLWSRLTKNQKKPDKVSEEEREIQVIQKTTPSQYTGTHPLNIKPVVCQSISTKKPTHGQPLPKMLLLITRELCSAVVRDMLGWYPWWFGVGAPRCCVGCASLCLACLGQGSAIPRHGCGVY